MGQALWTHSNLGILSCAKLRNIKLLLLPRPKGGADSTILKSYLRVNSELLFTSHDIKVFLSQNFFLPFFFWNWFMKKSVSGSYWCFVILSKQNFRACVFQFSPKELYIFWDFIFGTRSVNLWGCLTSWGDLSRGMRR